MRPMPGVLAKQSLPTLRSCQAMVMAIPMVGPTVMPWSVAKAMVPTNRSMPPKPTRRRHSLQVAKRALPASLKCSPKIRDLCSFWEGKKDKNVGGQIIAPVIVDRYPRRAQVIAPLHFSSQYLFRNTFYVCQHNKERHLDQKNKAGSTTLPQLANHPSVGSGTRPGRCRHRHAPLSARPSL